jgi:hypothetical protein
MKRYLITLAVIILIIMAKDVFAETVVTRSIPLSPFYVNSLTTAGQNYNFTFNASDGLSRVLNALLKFKVLASSTVNFTAFVNGTSCNNPFFFISITSIGQFEITFDCSNIINTTGRFNVSLRPSANTGSVVGWVEITYLNSPKIDSIIISNFTALNSSIVSVNDTVKNVNNTLPSSIWTFTNRTLTSFDFLVNVTQQALDNIASTVWSFSSRTLTAFNFLVDLTSNALNNIASFVWNTTFPRTIDETNIKNNFTALNSSIISVNDTVKNVNNTLQSNILTFFTALNSSIVSVNDTVKNVNNTLPSSIWTFTNRTLTSFDFLVNVTQQALDNIASTVWSFSSRTLTAFNFLVDLTSNALNNIASAVWNFGNRTVDNATFVTNVTNVQTVFNVTSISDDVLDDMAFRVLKLFIGAKNILLR